MSAPDRLPADPAGAPWEFGGALPSPGPAHLVCRACLLCLVCRVLVVAAARARRQHTRTGAENRTPNPEPAIVAEGVTA